MGNSILDRAADLLDPGVKAKGAVEVLVQRNTAQTMEIARLRAALAEIRDEAEDRMDGAADSSLGDKACGRIHGLACEALREGRAG